MALRVNRLVMLRARGLDGPFMQRIGGGRLVHTTGNFLGSVGRVDADIKICADFTQCSTTATTTPPAFIGADFTLCTTTASLRVSCPTWPSAPAPPPEPPPGPEWLLASGQWDDAGIWDDTENWSDA